MTPKDTHNGRRVLKPVPPVPPQDTPRRAFSREVLRRTYLTDDLWHLRPWGFWIAGQDHFVIPDATAKDGWKVATGPELGAYLISLEERLKPHDEAP